MRKCSLSNLDALFAAIAGNATLYLPVEKEQGSATYEKWTEGTVWSNALNTVRSPKDFFFPQTEDLMKFKPDAECIVSPHPIYSNFGEKLSRESACSELGISPDKKNLLFFGLIRDYKGLDILIDAFSQLDDSYQLIIAGEPYGSFEKYEKQIAASPLKENIKLFTSYIPDDQVAPFFCASDLCVLPYRSATQSGISSIAYHFNLPMVTTPVGGLKESIGDTGTGIITENVSSEAVTKAIKCYFENEENKSVFSQNIDNEKERLSWSTFANNLINLYNKL